MELGLTAEQHGLVAATRDNAVRVIRPALARPEELERAEDFPFDLMREGSDLGLKALPLPREYGGRDADMLTQCLIAEDERRPPAPAPAPSRPPAATSRCPMTRQGAVPCSRPPRSGRQARVFAADVALEVTQKAMFLFGGRGMMSGWPVEKLVRDTLTLTHGNCTSALMTLRIGTEQE